MSQDKKPKPPIVLKDKPIVCMTLDYYSEPSELLVKEIYACIIEEVNRWNKTHKGSIEGTHLYRDLAFGSPRYMLIIRCKDVADAATFVNSDTFTEIRNMAINANFTVNSNILAYDSGEENDFGDG